MTDPIERLLRDLMQLPGASGRESVVAQRMAKEWRPLVDKVSLSPLGNVMAIRRGSGKAPRPSVLLSAHMDTIGLVVSETVESWARVRPIGRFDARVLPGQSVTIHGHKPVDGLIVVPPPHCLPPDKRSNTVDTHDLLVDTGLPAARLSALVSPGDVVTFAQPPIEISEGILAGPYLDNRASLVALTQCLRELESRRHTWDVIAAATVQEEVSAAGGRTAGFSARPTIAVIIDVTYGRSPGMPEYLTFPMGGGPTNGWGPHVHPSMHDYIRDCAERAEIPLATELMPVNSLTEADQMQRVAAGIPTAIVGLPIRYMHSPVEMIYLQDVWMTGRLLAEIVTGLTPHFIDRLTWD